MNLLSLLSDLQRFHSSSVCCCWLEWILKLVLFGAAVVLGILHFLKMHEEALVHFCSQWRASNVPSVPLPLSSYRPVHQTRLCLKASDCSHESRAAPGRWLADFFIHTSKMKQFFLFGTFPYTVNNSQIDNKYFVLTVSIDTQKMIQLSHINHVSHQSSGLCTAAECVRRLGLGTWKTTMQVSDPSHIMRGRREQSHSKKMRRLMLVPPPP